MGTPTDSHTRPSGTAEPTPERRIGPLAALLGLNAPLVFSYGVPFYAMKQKDLGNLHLFSGFILLFLIGLTYNNFVRNFSIISGGGFEYLLFAFLLFSFHVGYWAWNTARVVSWLRGVQKGSRLHAGLVGCSILAPLSVYAILILPWLETPSHASMLIGLVYLASMTTVVAVAWKTQRTLKRTWNHLDVNQETIPQGVRMVPARMVVSEPRHPPVGPECSPQAYLLRDYSPQNEARSIGDMMESGRAKLVRSLFDHTHDGLQRGAPSRRRSEFLAPPRRSHRFRSHRRARMP